MRELLQKTRDFFELRVSKPGLKLERRPSSIACVMTTATADKVEFSLDDWVAYVRVVASNRVYMCLGSTVQSYAVLATVPVKETGIAASVWGSTPSNIIKIKNSRTLSFVPAAGGAVWCTVEMWGEDDL